MRIIIDEINTYDGPEWRWKVFTDGDHGFYLSGQEASYRFACRQAKRACKRLAGIGWLAYQAKE